MEDSVNQYVNIDHEALYISKLEQTLTSEECAAFIDLIDAGNPKRAPINTKDGESFDREVRNNERVMMRDIDLAKKIFERVKNRLPAEVHLHRLSGLNEMFRCYRYKAGMHFSPHSDGAYHRDKRERSFYTFLIYLNTVLEGGETNFLLNPN